MNIQQSNSENVFNNNYANDSHNQKFEIPADIADNKDDDKNNISLNHSQLPNPSEHNNQNLLNDEQFNRHREDNSDDINHNQLNNPNTKNKSKFDDDNNHNNNQDIDEQDINKIIQEKLKLLGQNLPETSESARQNFKDNNSNLPNQKSKNFNINTIPVSAKEIYENSNNQPLQIQPPSLLQQQPPFINQFQNNQMNPYLIQGIPQNFQQYQITPPNNIYNPNPYQNQTPMIPNINMNINPYQIPQGAFDYQTNNNYNQDNQAESNSNENEQEIMMLKIKNSNLESENSVLKEKIKEMRSQMKNNDNTKKNEKQIKELKTKYENIKSSNDREMKESRDTITNLTLQNNKLREELSLVKKNFEKEEKEKLRLLSVAEQMKKEIITLKKKVSKLENDNDTLYEEKSLIEDKFNKNEEKLRNGADTIKEMKNDYELLNKRYFQIKKENEKLLNEIQNANEQNYFYRDKNSVNGSRNNTISNTEYSIGKKNRVNYDDEDNYNNNNNNYDNGNGNGNGRSYNNNNRNNMSNRGGYYDNRGESTSFDDRPMMRNYEENRSSLPVRNYTESFATTAIKTYNRKNFDRRLQEEEESLNRQNYKPERPKNKKITKNYDDENEDENDTYALPKRNSQRRKKNEVEEEEDYESLEKMHDGYKIQNIKNEIAKHQNNISQLTYEKNRIENELLQIPDSQKTPGDKKMEVELENKLSNVNREINYNKRKIRELNKYIK